MEATLDSLALGFSVAFRPDVLLYAFLGCLVGTLVGILPGIGPLAGISILLPVTLRTLGSQFSLGLMGRRSAIVRAAMAAGLALIFAIFFFWSRSLILNQ